MYYIRLRVVLISALTFLSSFILARKAGHLAVILQQNCYYLRLIDAGLVSVDGLASLHATAEMSAHAVGHATFSSDNSKA